MLHTLNSMWFLITTETSMPWITTGFIYYVTISDNNYTLLKLYYDM